MELGKVHFHVYLTLHNQKLSEEKTGQEKTQTRSSCSWSKQETSSTRKTVTYSTDEVADLCQAWYQAGKSLGIYLTNN